MERIKFIRGIYSKFVLNYIIFSFLIMYLIRYIIVIIQSSIQENTLHNPFITEILTEKRKPEQNTPKEYFLKYKDEKTNKLKETAISYSFYMNIKNLDYDENNSYTIKLTNNHLLNTKNIIKVYEKNNLKTESISKKVNLSRKEIKERHIQHIKNIYTDFIFLILMAIGLIFYINKKTRLHKFYLIPYDFNFFQTFGTEQQRKKVYDKFIRKTKKGEYIFQNRSKTNYDKYLKELENIKQNLNFESLEIQRYKTKQLILKKTELVEKLAFDETKLQENKIHIGFKRGNKDTYLDIEGLNHSILIGESGSGKSVFVQNLITSFFYNEDKFEKFIMIDPKRVELSRYKIFKKVDYIENMEKVFEMFENLQKTMYDRLEEMENLGQVKSKKPFILVLIDEFRTLKNNSLEKKINDKMEKILIDLIQKCRATNIRIILAGQKRDTQNLSSNVLSNIQTRILLKTKNNDNISKIGGNSEELETYSITLNDIKNFPKGRGIYKDGDTGEVYLFQSPFFNIENEEHKNFMFSLLEKREEYIENNTSTAETPQTENNEDIQVENNEISDEMKLLQYESLRNQYWEMSSRLENTAERGKKVRSLLIKFKRRYNEKDFLGRDSFLEEIKPFFE